MDIGITEPKFASLDDDSSIVVKLSNGPEGNLVLFNEYVCYRMAMLINLPMPHCGICIMDDHTEVSDPQLASNENFGHAFYSTYMHKTTRLVPSVISMVSNKDVFLTLLLFDHIIFNKDRNEGNLLVGFYKDDIDLKVIDHTHVFINEAIWDANCLTRAMDERDLFSTEILKSNELLYDMFYKNVSVTEKNLQQASTIFKDKLNRDVVRNIINQCPIEWRPNEDDENTLVEYLMYRLKNVDIIISTIINYLKEGGKS